MPAPVVKNLPEPFRAPDSDWQSESFLMVELVNVFATAMRIARALGQPLVTEDAKLRRAAPGFTCSLAEALAG